MCVNFTPGKQCRLVAPRRERPVQGLDVHGGMHVESESRSGLAAMLPGEVIDKIGFPVHDRGVGSRPSNIDCTRDGRGCPKANTGGRTRARAG